MTQNSFAEQRKKNVTERTFYEGANTKEETLNTVRFVVSKEEFVRSKQKLINSVHR